MLELICKELEVEVGEEYSGGELKPMWIPKEGDWYYFPEVAYSVTYGVGIWYDNKKDKERLKRGIIFKTKDEAMECANYMLDAIK